VKNHVEAKAKRILQIKKDRRQMQEKPDVMYVEGNAGVEYKGKVYFSSFNPTGCLFCFDIEKGTTTFIKQFSVEISRGMCHIDAFLCENEAWFIPWGARRLVCVNLDNFEEEYFEIAGHDYTNEHAFIDYLPFGDDKLILIPCGHRLDTMVIVDLKRHSTEEFFHVIPKGKCIGAYIWENKLHFLSVYGDVISLFDLKKMEIKHLCEEVEGDGWRYSSLIQNGSIVYLIPREADNVQVINLCTNARRQIMLPFVEEPFCGGTLINGGVLLFACCYGGGDSSGKKMTDSGMIRCLKIHGEDDPAEICNFPHGRSTRFQYYMRKIYSTQEQSYQFIIGSGGNLFQIDKNGCIVNTWDYSIEIASSWLKPRFDRRITMQDIRKHNPKVIMENEKLGIRDFASVLIKESSVDNQAGNKNVMTLEEN